MQAMVENMMKDWMKKFDGFKGFEFPKQTDFMKDLSLPKIGRQVLDFQKATYYSTYDMYVEFQEQTEKTADSWLKDHAVIPAEGLKMLDDWHGMVKKGQDEMKKVIDESFKQSEAFLANFDQFAAPKQKAVKAPAPKKEKAKKENSGK